jgi:hypothetical protein
MNPIISSSIPPPVKGLVRTPQQVRESSRRSLKAARTQTIQYQGRFGGIDPAFRRLLGLRGGY